MLQDILKEINGDTPGMNQEQAGEEMSGIAAMEMMLEQVYELEGLIALSIHRENVPEKIMEMIREKAADVAEMAGLKVNDETEPYIEEESEPEPAKTPEEDPNFYFEVDDAPVPAATSTRRRALKLDNEYEDSTDREAKQDEEFNRENEESSEEFEKENEESSEKFKHEKEESSEEFDRENEENTEEFEEEEADEDEEFEEGIPQSRQVMTPVFSVNDRFLYTRELFNGDFKKFESSLKEIAGFDSYEEAEEYFYSSLGFDAENPMVSDFMIIISKCFV